MLTRVLRRVWPRWLRGRVKLETVLSGATPMPVAPPPVLPSAALHACFPQFAPLDAATYERIEAFKQLSMLHVDTLLALRHLVQISQGTIVEIGPYVGGATLVMAQACKESRQQRPFLVVEAGGSYPTHPHFPATKSSAIWKTTSSIKECGTSWKS
jgi:hypothetical protein